MAVHAIRTKDVKTPFHLLCLILLTAGCASDQTITVRSAGGNSDNSRDAGLVDDQTNAATEDNDAFGTDRGDEIASDSEDASTADRQVDAGEAAGSDDDVSSVEETRNLATQIDALCALDCEKDILCNPEEADDIDTCISQYCGYADEVDESLASREVIDCLRAELTLFECVTQLDCGQYTIYYYAEVEDENICAAEVAGFDIACSEFFEE